MNVLGDLLCLRGEKQQVTAPSPLFLCLSWERDYCVRVQQRLKKKIRTSPVFVQQLSHLQWLQRLFWANIVRVELDLFSPLCSSAH